jgi:hypothetical protein
MNSFYQFVQHHRRLRPIAPGPRSAKNSAGSPNATMLDGATQAVFAAWLLLVSIHERRGDVPRKRQHRVSQAVETCLGILAIPPEISTGALFPPGQAPAPAELHRVPLFLFARLFSPCLRVSVVDVHL